MTILNNWPNSARDRDGKDLGVIIRDTLSSLAQVVEVRNKALRIRGI